MLYLNRRVTRSEFAKRISALENGHLTRVATKWFWDKDVSASLWGPVHNIMQSSWYNRPWRRTTLGNYGNLYMSSV